MKEPNFRERMIPFNFVYHKVCQLYDISKLYYVWNGSSIDLCESFGSGQVLEINGNFGATSPQNLAADNTRLTYDT